ncbi:ABC transporter substrate-binding protein [Paenibacillus hodogayensis]|uniref:ABC transporter substrate-binding protein n=1 Tax=Paenibacillus hodogayensis TaxID=279208 RepID=A0ABV5W1N9_9BACL
MRHRKHVYLLAGCLLAQAALAGCGGGTSGKEGSDQPGQDGKPVVSNDPVTLSFKMNVGSITSQEGFMTVFGDKIKEKFPHVTPVFVPADVTLKTILETGQPLDIYYDSFANTPTNLLQNGLQYDLTGLIKQYNYDVSPLEKTSVDAQRQLANGGMYGLPVSIDSVALLYNKGLFNQFGLPYPKDNMTMDDLYELTRKMSRVVDGVNYYGFGTSLGFVLSLDPLAPQFVDPASNKGSFSSETFKRPFQALTGLFRIPNNEYDKTTLAYSAQLKMFGEQRLAMLLGPNALGTRYFADKDKTLDWDLTTYPTYKEAANTGPQNAPGYFYVTSNSKHKEAAFQVAAYVTSPEFQKHLARKGYVPALQKPEIVSEFGKDIPFLKDKHVQALFTANPAPIVKLTPYQAIALAEAQTAFNDIQFAGKDLNTVLREADERINQKIAAELAKSK